MQNMSAREPNATAPGGGRLRVSQVESAHVIGRVRGPALTANIVIEAAIAVGADIEPRQLLIAQIAGQCVLVLLAEAAADHGFEEMTRAKIFRVPARPRQRAGDGGWQHDVFGCPVHSERPPYAGGERGRRFALKRQISKQRRVLIRRSIDAKVIPLALLPMGKSGQKTR